MINLWFYIALVVECVTGAVAGRQTFECEANNQLIFVGCTFDGGHAESCSFPLVVTIDKFGTEKHTLDVLFVDEFFQGKEVSLDFQLVERKCVANTRNLVLNNY